MIPQHKIFFKREIRNAERRESEHVVWRAHEYSYVMNVIFPNATKTQDEINSMSEQTNRQTYKWSILLQFHSNWSMILILLRNSKYKPGITVW